MPAPVVMVVGTASSVGKSTLVTALCRIAARRGIRVAPFKAQNMSNNAAVTADGGEIGRSTAAQAEAAGIAPTTRMNPILIKPEGERRSQIVVEGRPWRSLDALDYWQRRETLWEIVTRNLDGLREAYDLVIAEGAGSPVELNLKARDIVNMRVATYANARTLLVGDIDVGGIFAAMLGTLMLLDPHERALIQGMVVNRFRGDPALFQDGIAILEERGQAPVLGVVPWIDDLGIAEEDAVALGRPQANMQQASSLTIAVVQFPQIANFDDFDALRQEPGVTVKYVTDPSQIRSAAAVILPGAKHTLGALRWLRERGFEEALQDYWGSIVGICGGYQMLGRWVSDPEAVEGAGGDETGLGLLPVETVFEPEKRTALVHGWSLLPWAADVPLNGYEIHMGRTRRSNEGAAAIKIADAAHPLGELDGCISHDGRVWGCYLHGLFRNDGFRRAWLRGLGWQGRESDGRHDPYDRLADVVEQHFDAEQLAATLGA